MLVGDDLRSHQGTGRVILPFVIKIDSTRARRRLLAKGRNGCHTVAMKMLRFLCVSCLLLGSAGSLPAQEWISLFDGKSLEGWKASDNPATFKVESGAIVAQGPRAHLFYVGPANNARFKNFEFSAEINAGPGANSGIYFHTAFQPTNWPGAGFEVQVNNSATLHGNYLEMKKTGSLYGIRNVYKQLIPDNTWFTMTISVRGKQVQVRVNDLLVVDYQEPEEAPAKALSQGTFALQGHDPESRVSFRNLRVRTLPDTAVPAAKVVVDNTYREILRLGGANFPLVDFHTHLKGGLTLEEVLRHTLDTGMGHGVAVNCGLNFSITNDAGIADFLKAMPPSQVFVGMQAEGREWVKLFSREAIARFDYVFTDAMTITDTQGKRSRLWIKEEVDVPDKQAFMEKLVSTIEQIIANEPIDIYVNPTFLPDVIAAEYDSLWTEPRKQRVIAAAARNSVAIEISSRYRLPKADFIKAAKKAGVKFTLGTNNGGREILPNDHGLQMIRDCNLAWQDMWMPRPDGQKKAQAK